AADLPAFPPRRSSDLVEQVDGVLVEVAGLEDVLVPLVLRHHRLAGGVVAGLLAQGVQREQAGQFGDGYGHGTWSGEVCPESIATLRVVVGPGPACLPPAKKEGPPFRGPFHFGWGTRIRT